MRLRIGTFNLESLDDGPEAFPPLAERLSILRPQLARIDADILCLQEIHGRRRGKGEPRRLSALDVLITGTSYAEYHRVETTKRDGPGALDIHNLAILSRLPLNRSRQVWHDLAPPPTHHFLTADPAISNPEPVAWDRPILTAEVDLGAGRTLRVLNLHLRAPLAAYIPGQKIGPFAWKSASAWAEGYFLAALKRTGQALEARLCIDRWFDADVKALIVVAGDCNSEMRETALRLLRADEEDT